MLWVSTREWPDPDLKLAITLDVESGGWLVEMTTPGLVVHGDPVYSRTVSPWHAIEQGTTDAYIDALLLLHFKLLGFT